MRKHGKLSKDARAMHKAFKARAMQAPTFEPSEETASDLRRAGINLAIRNRDVSSVAIYGRPDFTDEKVVTLTRKGKERVEILPDPRRVYWIVDRDTRGGILPTLIKDRSALTRRSGSTLSHTFRGRNGLAILASELRTMREANTIAHILGDVKPVEPLHLAAIARKVYAAQGQAWRRKLAKIIEANPGYGFDVGTIAFDRSFEMAIKGEARKVRTLTELVKDHPILRGKVR